MKKLLTFLLSLTFRFMNKFILTTLTIILSVMVSSQTFASNKEDLNTLKSLYEHDLKVNGSTSFDCTLSRTVVEKSICGNWDLGFLDRVLSLVYLKNLSLGNNEIKNKLKQSQWKWLTKRDECKTLVCLETVYLERIGFLYPKSTIVLDLISKMAEVESNLQKTGGYWPDNKIQDHRNRLIRGLINLEDLSVPYFINQLNNSGQDHIQAYSAYSLGEIESSGGVFDLIKKLDHKTLYVRSSIEEALIKIGDKAVQQLFESVTSENFLVKDSIIRILSVIGKDAVSILDRGLGSSNLEIQQSSREALTLMSSDQLLQEKDKIDFYKLFNDSNFTYKQQNIDSRCIEQILERKGEFIVFPHGTCFPEENALSHFYSDHYSRDNKFEFKHVGRITNYNIILYSSLQTKRNIRRWRISAIKNLVSPQFKLQLSNAWEYNLYCSSEPEMEYKENLVTVRHSINPVDFWLRLKPYTLKKIPDPIDWGFIGSSTAGGLNDSIFVHEEIKSDPNLVVELDYFDLSGVESFIYPETRLQNYCLMKYLDDNKILKKKDISSYVDNVLSCSKSGMQRKN